jgi:peptidoglycan/xylan/chitin deacetylase (PgdA/CDA1 family)
MTQNASTKIIATLLVFILCSVFQRASAQEVAFAFDKTLASSAGLDGTARTKMLVRNLQKMGIDQSMFLIRTKDINVKTMERVEFYDDEAQLIVNAGAKHSLYSRHGLLKYQADILKADALLEQHFHYKKHIYFPYLFSGGDNQVLTELRTFLADEGYRKTYVSYEAHDDYMDLLYRNQVANNRVVDISSIEKAYVKMLMDEILAYDAKAYLLLGYHPKQVILLHENDLAAYCIIGLVDALNAKGFKVISPEKIFSDPIANPFFADGYSAVGYMRSVTGFSDARRDNLHVLTEAEKQKIHGYLREQGQVNLIP